MKLQVLIYQLRERRSGREVTIDLKRFSGDNLRLGYASSTHKAQGASIPFVHVLMGGPLTDLHMGYVQASRSIEGTHLFCDKHTAGGPQLADLIRSLGQEGGRLTKRTIKHANEVTCQVGLSGVALRAVRQSEIDPRLTLFGHLPDVRLRYTPSRHPQVKPHEPDATSRRLTVLYSPFREVTPGMGKLSAGFDLGTQLLDLAVGVRAIPNEREPE